jgi:hypothetical protein
LEELRRILGDREIPPAPAPIDRDPLSPDAGESEVEAEPESEPELEVTHTHTHRHTNNGARQIYASDTANIPPANTSDYRALKDTVAEQARAIKQLTEVIRELAKMQRQTHISTVPPFVRVMERFKLMPLFRALEWRARKVVIGVVRDDADVLDTLDDAALQSWLEEILRDHRIALPRVASR